MLRRFNQSVTSLLVMLERTLGGDLGNFLNNQPAEHAEPVAHRPTLYPSKFTSYVCVHDKM